MDKIHTYLTKMIDLQTPTKIYYTTIREKRKVEWLKTNTILKSMQYSEFILPSAQLSETIQHVGLGLSMHTSYKGQAWDMNMFKVERFAICSCCFF